MREGLNCHYSPFTDYIVRIFLHRLVQEFGYEWHRMVTFNRVILLYFRRLRDLREDSDLSQQAIADYLFVQRTVYCRYERGEREIPVWALIKLADLYHTSTDYILGRTNRRGPIK